MNSSVTFWDLTPDNDFSNITVRLAGQWPSFKPSFLPHGLIYNIIWSEIHRGQAEDICYPGE